jgi:DNA-binding NarL/FixJ family response regulator
MNDIIIYAPPGWFFSSWEEAWPQAKIQGYNELNHQAKLSIVLAQGDAWQSTVQNLAAYSSVLVLSPNESSTELQQALLAGARGYALMTSHVTVLQLIGQTLLSGALWLPQHFLNQIIGNANQALPKKATPVFDALSTREKEVALAVCEGLSNKNIAANLGVSERTVKQHLTNIFQKLNISDRMQLLIVSRQQ